MDFANISGHTKQLAGFFMRKFPNYRVGVKNEDTFYVCPSFFHALRFDYIYSLDTYTIRPVVSVFNVVWGLLAFLYIILCAYVFFELDGMSHYGWSKISLVLSIVVGFALLYFTLKHVTKSNERIAYAFHREFPYSDARTDIEYFDTHIGVHEKSKRHGLICMSIFLGAALLLYLINFNGIQNLFFGSPYSERYPVNSYEKKYSCYLDSVSGKYGVLKIAYEYPSDMDDWERRNVYYSSYDSYEGVSKSMDTITSPIFLESVYFDGDLGWYEKDGAYQLVNYKGEVVFAPKEYHIFHQLDQVMPDLYVVELGNEWLPHEVFSINSRGERTMHGPISTHSYAISEDEFWSGDYIYSINGDKRISDEGWVKISLLLSTLVLIILFIGLWRVLIIRSKKGKVLNRWFTPVWQLGLARGRLDC